MCRLHNENVNFKALDPALPLFITAVPADKLDATDADFVDVYHSNAFVQGQIESCGTVDFYMNGGIGKVHSLEKIISFKTFKIIIVCSIFVVQPGCFSFGSSKINA